MRLLRLAFPRAQVWAVLALGLVFIGVSLFIVATVTASHQRQAQMSTNTNDLAKNTSDVAHLTTIAAQAKEQATTAQVQAKRDSAMIYAVCQRFQQNEGINEYAARELNEIEDQYPRPNVSVSDMAYHVARRNALAKIAGMRLKQLHENCPGQLDAAIESAPNNGSMPTSPL